ncbi:MAG TPA: serine hydrolase domain-containing protein [Thermoguttaceae bacterium]|nr:serine hydrolase domain-containing protein [Thermoguttaceae bacterium]
MRWFLVTLLAWTVVACHGHRAHAELTDLPITGRAVRELASFDRVVCRLMQDHDIPGGAVAVAKDGRLLLSRGYGWADVERREPVEPEALFRIASVSKPITALALLVLVQQGRLDLDAKAVDLIGPIRPLDGESIEPALKQITVRQLLHHTAGFDRDASFDPMFPPRQMTTLLEEPINSRSIIGYMLGRPLDFPPGECYAYSNFGYCMLGRILEQVTGEPYDRAVERLVLRPVGITRMRLGKTRLEDRARDEVCYYVPDDRCDRSVFPDVKQAVPIPYGPFYLEAMDSHGGWIASAADLVRLAASVDGTRKPRLLRPETVLLMESRPADIAEDAAAYYGLGWNIRPIGDSANWWHAGSLPGTSSLVVRTHHGLVWAVVLNSRGKDGNKLIGDMDRAMWRAVEQVETWPVR